MPIDKAALLETLEEAYFSGALRIAYQDRNITYRTALEMRGTIQQLKRELGLVSGRSRRKVIATRKGLGGETAGNA